MDNRPAENVAHDLDALFRLGVVAGMSDEQLLERFAAQTESDSQIAFDAIVRRHGHMVMGVCRRLLGHHHDAEDAFQATFIVLALRAGAVRKGRSLGPWLHGVAARICQRARAVSRRRQEEPIPEGGLIDPGGRDPALGDLNRVLDEELRRLPEKYRLPVVLCYLEGRSQEEAARELGWTKGTVSGRLARAKEVLRHRLIRRGLAPSAALVAACLESEPASAAVSAPLLASTVRTATLASFSGLRTGSITTEVVALVRAAVTSLLLGRVAKGSALVLLLGVGASAIGTQILGPARPVRQRNTGAIALATAGRAAPERRGPLFDRYGDPLPPDAVARLGTVQRRHTARVVGVAFSHDGNAAVTAQADGLVRFWAPKTGGQERAIDFTTGTHGDRKSIRQFAISRDGRYMAAAGFVQEAPGQHAIDKVWIMSLPEARALRTIDTKTIDLQCLAFSPDSKTIATGASVGEVKLWDVASGDCLKTTKLVENQPVFSLSFSADGEIVATNQQGKGVKLWNLESGDTELLAMPSIGGFAPHFSDDGRYMAISKRDGEAVVWDRRAKRMHCTARGFAQGFAPDGRSLAVTRSDDGSLTLIDTDNGRERWKVVLGPALQPGGLAFSPDGRTMIVGWDNVLRFFETEAGRERFVIDEAHQGAVSAVRYTPDGHSLVTAGNDGTIRQWDASSGRQIRVINDGGVAQVLAMAPDGKAIASAAMRAQAPAFRVWDLMNGQLRREFLGNANATGKRAVAFSSDGRLVLAYSPKLGLKIVDIATGDEREDVVQPQFVLQAGEESELGLASSAFAPGNLNLAMCTGLATHVVDLASGAERFSCAGHTMTFAPDGQRIAVANEGDSSAGPAAGESVTSISAVEMVEIATGARKRIVIQTDRISALAFSPDGKILAVAAGWRESSIRLYEVEDGREIDAFMCPATRTHPGALAFAPDCRSVAVGLDDTSVVIWAVRRAQ